MIIFGDNEDNAFFLCNAKMQVLFYASLFLLVSEAFTLLCTLD